MSSIQLKFGGLILMTAGLVLVVGFQRRQNQLQQAELLALRAEVAAAATAAAPVPAEPVAPVPSEELLRLRAEVAKFRRAFADLEKVRADSARRSPTEMPLGLRASENLDEAAEREAVKAHGIARLNYAKAWGIALTEFANEHGGVLPETLAEAEPYFHPELGVVPLSPDQFELMYHGSLKNIQQPAQTIILREKQPWSNALRPGTARTYLFADGHSEIKASPDGNFDAWEKERLQPSPP